MKRWLSMKQASLTVLAASLQLADAQTLMSVMLADLLIPNSRLLSHTQ